MDTTLDRANIECKLALRDRAAAEATCRALGAHFRGVLEQTDTYYPCAQGRLKRRETTGRETEWILYHRANDAGARESRYTLMTESQARECFPDLPEPTATVRKRRALWTLDNVRIHLDDVESLGAFFELEAVVGAAHTPELCAQRVAELLRAFAPSLGAHQSISYADMLRAV